MNENPRTAGNLSSPSLGSSMYLSGQQITREYPSFTDCHLAAILHMRGMTTMKEMRTLFEALGVLGVIVATGTILALLLR